MTCDFVGSQINKTQTLQRGPPKSIGAKDSGDYETQGLKDNEEAKEDEWNTAVHKEEDPLLKRGGGDIRVEGEYKEEKAFAIKTLNF